MITAAEARKLSDVGKTARATAYVESAEGIAAMDLIDGEIQAAIAIDPDVNRVQIYLAALGGIYLNEHPGATEEEIRTFIHSTKLEVEGKGFECFVPFRPGYVNFLDQTDRADAMDVSW